MSFITWKINGTLVHELGLKDGRVTYGSLQASTLSFRHAGAAWDADPLFVFDEAVRLEQVVMDDDGVTVLSTVGVFAGKRLADPREFGPDSENLSYTFSDVWDELTRRPLLQNQAVVLDPESSSEPSLVAQGLIVLGQDDGGASVTVAQALTTFIAAAAAAGVSIALGEVTGFDFTVDWDIVADLTIADAILRVLKFSPDAVSEIDYDPEVPVIHFRRRANLTPVSLPISPIGQGEFPAYVATKGLRIRERKDLVPTFVAIHIRRSNSENGATYLTIDKQTAGPGAETDDRAIVRTLQLAGSNFSETRLSQECTTTPLAAALTAGGTITAGSDFDELSKFWKRKCPELAATNITLKGFRNTAREATPVLDSDGNDATPTLDTSLVRELIEGAITPWMENSTLNRKAQDQTYRAEIAYDEVVDGVTKRQIETYQAGVQATNASTRPYNWQESGDEEEAEPAPEDLATSIYNGLKANAHGEAQHEGRLLLIERECSLSLRPGKHALNLTGSRIAYTRMNAVIQTVSADLDKWESDVTFGWPDHLGPADLVDLARANRLKSPADTALMRSTGRY